MAKDRLIKCKSYLYEGSCAKGRAGTFYGACQKCDKYEPVRGSVPAKKNLKREKLQKARESDEY